MRANDAPGFIVNRVLMPMLNEACFALGEGVATIPTSTSPANWGSTIRSGPLTLADFIGLDTCLEITRVLFEGTGDAKLPPRAAAGSVRGGLVRPQGRARLLRLFGRRAGPDPLR
ncbi:3-hydroxyacyl-CoA dehydrogenase family protein [Sphingomonas sp. MMS24-JH45]